MIYQVLMPEQQPNRPMRSHFRIMFLRRNEGSAARSHRRSTATFEAFARPSVERCDADKCCIANAMAFSNLE
jgi:hypothetical protein